MIDRSLLLASFIVASLFSGVVQAQTTLRISSGDFVTTPTFNEITSFNFEIQLADSIAAGQTYSNPQINRVDYIVNGSLPNPTPSGFGSFRLIRGYSGTDFYDQSPDSGLQFAIRADAELSDGLQVSELVGTGTETIFYFNARELNQSPGRYHPPELTLLADGTGTLRNANNMSTFNNPPPPIGSGMLVDVDFGEEYDNGLSFNPALVTIAAIPEPAACVLLLSGVAALAQKRKRLSL